MKLGTFHRILPLRCPEELTNYLSQVKSTWDYILCEDGGLPLQLDSFTVQYLEGRCPRSSSEDLTIVEKQFTRGKLFSSPSFNAYRSDIFRRVRTVRYPIPSIHTFLEDTKYLEPCTRIMKTLLDGKFKGSIRQAFDSQHSGQSVYPEQIDETTTVQRTVESGIEARWRSYRQLWLFSFRHFPEITGQAPRKNVQRPKPVTNGIDYTWWSSMAALASNCGYTRVSNTFRDADETMAREFLRLVRPPPLYQSDDTGFDVHIGRIYDALKMVRPRQIVIEPPSISSDFFDCGSDISSRYGRPFEKAFQDDACHLFMRFVYDDRLDSGQKRFLTNFGVKRHIFRSFFGSPASDRILPATASPLADGMILRTDPTTAERSTDVINDE